MTTRPKPSKQHRLTSVQLHVPAREHKKPEMVRFVKGQDKRRRAHLEDTAQALADAEHHGLMTERERLKRQLANAHRLHMVWGMLTFWASEADRLIEWDRFKRGPLRTRFKNGYTVWAIEGEDTIATVQGKDASQAAERLAVKLGLVEKGELL